MSELELFHRALGVETKAVREDMRAVDVVMSDESIDSYGEVVSQKSWRLDRYKANPIVLYAHSSRDLPIGRAENVRVAGGQLECTIHFASEKANPQAEHVYQLFRERILNAVSVGFIPGRVTTEKRHGVDVTVLDDNELFELSVTPIPANPSALAKMRARALKTTAAATAAAEETVMTEQEKKALEDTIRVREADVRAAEKRAGDAETKSKALEAQNDALVKERDAALMATKAAQQKLVELEVDGLVGVKFTKEERDGQVELAMANRPLFEKLLAQRSPLPAAHDLTGKGLVVGADPTPAVVRDVGAHDSGEALEAEIQKALS